MDRTPLPLPLAAALALPISEGRLSAEVFVDGDLEVRLYAPKGRDLQEPHDRDELYVVARGSGDFRVGDTVSAVRCFSRRRTKSIASRISRKILRSGSYSTGRGNDRRIARRTGSSGQGGFPPLETLAAVTFGVAKLQTFRPDWRNIQVGASHRRRGL
jgi:hypothetical protein